MAGHHSANQLFVEHIDGCLAPHIPGVYRSPGCYIDALLWLIEPLLVLPLPVVDFLRSTSTAMQGYPQAAVAHRCIAIDGEPNGHPVVAVADAEVLHPARQEHRPVFIARLLHPLTNHLFPQLVALSTTQALPCRQISRAQQHQDGRQKSQNVHLLHCTLLNWARHLAGLPQIRCKDKKKL